MKKLLIVATMVLMLGLGYVLANIDNDRSSSTTGTTNQSDSSKTIDLAGRNLSEVSKSLLDNDKATELDVSNNNLTGSLPAEIRHLTNLQVLNASDNKLTGIPAEIGQLSKLKTANFANNDISGLPLEIGNLTNLEVLDLRGNPNISKYDISLIQPKIPQAQIITD